MHPLALTYVLVMSDDRLSLYCTDAQLHSLVKAVERAKKKKTVTVDVDALDKLIADHTRALRRVPHKVSQPASVGRVKL